MRYNKDTVVLTLLLLLLLLLLLGWGLLLLNKWSNRGRICALRVPDDEVAVLFQTVKVMSTPCFRVSEVMSGEVVALRHVGQLTDPGHKTAGGRIEGRDPGERVRGWQSLRSHGTYT